MLDAERSRPVAGDCAEPGQRRWMPIEDGDDAAVRGHVGKQPLDMRTRVHETSFAGSLRRGPARIEPVCGCDREQADITAILCHQADGFDGFRRHRAGVGNDDLAIGARFALPVGAVNDLLTQIRRDRPLHLLYRPGRQPQVN